MPESDLLEDSASQEIMQSPRWILPQKVEVVTPSGHKEVEIVGHDSKEIKSVENGEEIGEVHEFKIETETGTERVAFDFRLSDVGARDYVVITSGWHTWSGKETRGKQVGLSTIPEKLKGGKTTFVVEPGKGSEDVPKGEGVSYGWIDFRKKDGSENVALGVIPGFDAIEDIRFRQDGDDMVLSVRKELEGVEGRERILTVFLGKGGYAELANAFSKELGGLLGKVSPMKDRYIWFSWAAYGKGVTQGDIESEIEAAKEVGVDTMIIDDGWQVVNGQWEVKVEKFPDMFGLIQKMKENGVRPGIWIAPFMTMRESEIYRLHPEWLMKDERGKDLTVTNPQIQPTGQLRPLAERALGLDISIPEVREHLYGEFVRLAKMGFETFKVDFISIPFISPLSNKDQTSVEYYRQFWQEARRRIEQLTGKEVEFIACGAPMAESIGLFEGIRVSPDSAMPNLETLPIYGKVLGWLKNKPIFGEGLNKVFEKLDTEMYKDAAAVAFRRSLVFGKAHGLLVDGVHLNDPAVHIDEETKKQLALSLPVLNKMGVVHNLFVGDSLVRAGEKGREEWRVFLKRFKEGKLSSESFV